MHLTLLSVLVGDEYPLPFAQRKQSHKVVKELAKSRRPVGDELATSSKSFHCPILPGIFQQGEHSADHMDSWLNED